MKNLSLMMKKMEQWAHRLYPKTRFDDTLEKIEHLGSKRPVRVCHLIFSNTIIVGEFTMLFHNRRHALSGF